MPSDARKENHMMNEIIGLIVSIFTGKGGTLRLAIAGSLAAGTIYEVVNAGYGVRAVTKSGSSVVIEPSSADTAERTNATTKEDPENTKEDKNTSVEEAPTTEA